MKSTVERSKRTCEVKDCHLLAYTEVAVLFKGWQEDSKGQNAHVFEPGAEEIFMALYCSHYTQKQSP